MKQIDPSKLKDPGIQFKFAGGALIVGLLLLIADTPFSLLAFLFAIIWALTGLARHLKIKKWLKQLDKERALESVSVVEMVPAGDLSEGLEDPSPALNPENEPAVRMPSKPNPKVLIAFGAIVAILIAIIAFRAVTGDPFGKALNSCDIEANSLFPELGASIADDGTSLLINNKGTEDLFGLTGEQIACVLDALDAPVSIVAQMESTRALDGKQSDSWGKYSVIWSYHPNIGLDMIITRK